MKYTKNIGFYQNGDKFCLTYSSVRNICSNLVHNVEVSLVIPPGVVLDGYTIPKGTYSTLTNTWTIPTVIGNSLLEAEFCFEISSVNCETYFDFEFHIDTPGACTDCFNEPVYCIRVEGLSCCSLLPCLQELIIPGLGKVVYDMNNETEIELNTIVTTNRIIMVTVNGLEVDYQTQAVAGFMYYNIVGTKIVFSEAVTGIGRVKYLDAV